MLVQVLDRVGAGILIIDAVASSWPVRYASPTVERMLGCDAGTLIGRPWCSLLADPADMEGLCERLPTAETSPACRLRQRWQTRSGEACGQFLEISALHAETGSLAGWVITLKPESGVEACGSESEEPSAQESRIGGSRPSRSDGRDSVTGLANRGTFLEVLDHDWITARRESRRLGLIVFEVEALDRYRETFGRQAADSCLRRIAHAIQGSLRRRGDFAARIADHRFAALVGSGESASIGEFAAVIARRVQDLAIHHPRSPAGRYVTVAHRIASEVPRHDGSPQAMLLGAETGLDCAADEARQSQRA